MASQPKTNRRTFANIRKRGLRRRNGELRGIVFRLERGEISVSDAYDAVQESDKAQHSRLDRILEAIVG